MSVCVNCGVELEDDIQECPLCGMSISESANEKNAPLTAGANLKITGTIQSKEKSLLQRVVWQVTSIFLFSGIVSTLIFDLAVHKRVTWSIYPVTVCMIIFSYASLFAFWHAKKIYQIIAGLLLSAVLFILLDLLLPQSNWPLQLGLPLLCAVNFVDVIFIGSINMTKHRGLNVFAYSCVAMAVLCLSIEGILSFYHGNIVLRWSVIVSACMLPVTAALLFMHYRIKKNPPWKRFSIRNP